MSDTVYVSAQQVSDEEKIVAGLFLLKSNRAKLKEHLEASAVLLITAMDARERIELVTIVERLHTEDKVVKAEINYGNEHAELTKTINSLEAAIFKTNNTIADMDEMEVSIIESLRTDPTAWGNVDLDDEAQQSYIAAETQYLTLLFNVLTNSNHTNEYCSTEDMTDVNPLYVLARNDSRKTTKPVASENTSSIGLFASNAFNPESAAEPDPKRQSTLTNY